MDLTDALAFIAQNHRAVLATIRSDGNPQLSMVMAGTDRDEVIVSTRETAMKTKNLRRRPRATLIAFGENFFGPWVQVEGPVEVVGLPDAMAGLEAYYRQISGEHPDWDDYRVAMARERRVLLRVSVDRVGPNRAG